MICAGACLNARKDARNRYALFRSTRPFAGGVIVISLKCKQQQLDDYQLLVFRKLRNILWSNLKHEKFHSLSVY